MISAIIIITIALVLGLLRIWIGAKFAPEPFKWLNVYKDIAHIYIGGLIVAWYYEKELWQAYTAIGLTVLEVTVAIWSRMKHK